MESEEIFDDPFLMDDDTEFISEEAPPHEIIGRG